MPDRPRVFVSRRLPGDALERLAAEAEIDLWPGDLPPPYDELARRTASAHGLLCLLTDQVDNALIAASPNLRVISQMAVGYDNIDVAAAAARGIPVGHTPGVLTEATADLTFALILAVARRIIEAERFLRDGRWQTGILPASSALNCPAPPSASSATARSDRRSPAAPPASASAYSARTAPPSLTPRSRRSISMISSANLTSSPCMCP
jgi:hypothetical protein